MCRLAAAAAAIFVLALIFPARSNMVLAPWAGGGGGGTGSITIYNRDGVSASPANKIMRFDINGDHMDMWGNGFIQAGGFFYAYGISVGCGYRWQISSPFCGYVSYRSTDLVNWTPMGLAFDPAPYQSTCNIGGPACFMNWIVYNAANNNYVMWFTWGGGGPFALVFTSPTPYGPFVQSPAPTHFDFSVNSDFGVFVDPTDSAAYIIWTSAGGGTFIQRLNATYTDGVSGTGISIPAFVGDTPSIIGPVGGVYHLLHSGTCPLCPGAAVKHATASSVLGTWTSVADISTDSCGGQINGAFPMTIGGNQVYMFSADQENLPRISSTDSSGFAIPYWAPLTFSGTTLDPLVCQNSVVVGGLALGPGPNFPNVDQGDELAVPGFGGECDIVGGVARLQTFVPSSSTIAAVAMPIAKGTRNCIHSCNGADADLTVSLVAVDGSNNPTTTLASQTITNASASFSPVRTIFSSLTASVTPGQKYGIKLTSAATLGCWGFAFANTLPYPAGLSRRSTDGGSTWTTVAGQSLRFSVLHP